MKYIIIILLFILTIVSIVYASSSVRYDWVMGESRVSDNNNSNRRYDWSMGEPQLVETYYAVSVSGRRMFMVE